MFKSILIMVFAYLVLIHNIPIEADSEANMGLLILMAGATGLDLVWQLLGGGK